MDYVRWGTIGGFIGIMVLAVLLRPPVEVTADVVDGYAANVMVLWDSVDVFADSMDTTLSSAIYVEQSLFLSVWYQAISSVGTPNVALEILTSYDNTATRYALPQDSTVVLRYNNGWYEGYATFTIADSLKVETIQQKSLPRVLNRYMKIRVRGRATNRPDTRVRVLLFAQPPARTL